MDSNNLNPGHGTNLGGNIPNPNLNFNSPNPNADNRAQENPHTYVNGGQSFFVNARRTTMTDCAWHNFDIKPPGREPVRESISIGNGSEDMKIENTTFRNYSGAGRDIDQNAFFAGTQGLPRDFASRNSQWNAGPAANGQNPYNYGYNHAYEGFLESPAVLHPQPISGRFATLPSAPMASPARRPTVPALTQVPQNAYPAIDPFLPGGPVLPVGLRAASPKPDMDLNDVDVEEIMESGPSHSRWAL